MTCRLARTNWDTNAARMKRKRAEWRNAAQAVLKADVKTPELRTAAAMCLEELSGGTLTGKNSSLPNEPEGT